MPFLYAKKRLNSEKMLKKPDYFQGWMQNATTNVTIRTIITHFHFILRSMLFIDVVLLFIENNREEKWFTAP